MKSLLLACLFIGTTGTMPDLLDKAIKANGPWEQVRTLHYTQEFIGQNRWQSYSFSHPISLLDEGEYYVDLEKGMYHSHTLSHYPGGYLFDLVNVGKDSANFFYDTRYDRYGKRLSKSGSQSFQENLLSIQSAFPYYILKELAATKDPLTYTDSSIHRTGKNGVVTQYIFDTGTYLLKRIETGNDKRLFQQYQQRNGLLVPNVMLFTGEKDFSSTETLKEFKTNIPIPPAKFEVPSHYLLPTEIAKDVFMIDKIGGSRNVLFINMNDYIVVTEAPLSPEVCKPIIDIIHKTLPGKPIKYVHLSHHHSDHIDGLTEFVKEGATLVCAKPMEAAVRTLTTGMIETFSMKKVFEDANHRIELLEIPNSHAEGMSMLYLPKEGIIFEGDLLSIPEDGTITPAIATVKEMAQYITQHKIMFKRIVGFHNNPNITPAMFQQMLRMK